MYFVGFKPPYWGFCGIFQVTVEDKSSFNWLPSPSALVNSSTFSFRIFLLLDLFVFPTYILPLGKTLGLNLQLLRCKSVISMMVKLTIQMLFAFSGVSQWLLSIHFWNLSVLQTTRSTFFSIFFHLDIYHFGCKNSPFASDCKSQTNI